MPLRSLIASLVQTPGACSSIPAAARSSRSGTADKQKAPGRFVGDSGARRPSSVVVGQRRNLFRGFPTQF